MRRPSIAAGWHGLHPFCGPLFAGPADAKLTFPAPRRILVRPRAARYAWIDAARSGRRTILPPAGSAAILPPSIACAKVPCPAWALEDPSRSAPPHLTTSTSPPMRPVLRVPDSVPRSAELATNESRREDRNKIVPATRGRSRSEGHSNRMHSVHGRGEGKAPAPPRWMEPRSNAHDST